MIQIQRLKCVSIELDIPCGAVHLYWLCSLCQVNPWEGQEYSVYDDGSTVFPRSLF